MTRTVVVLVCFLLNLMSVASPLERRSEGKLNCISFSEPIFRSTSRSPLSPFFLNVKPFLNIFFNEAPVKPQTDAIYVPEPIEITETSPILHKVHKANKNTTEGEQETDIYFIQESSEEDLPTEYDHPEVTYNDTKIDVREDIHDTSSGEEHVGKTEKASSGEERDGNTSEEEFDTSAEDNEINRGPVVFP